MRNHRALAALLAVCSLAACGRADRDATVQSRSVLRAAEPVAGRYLVTLRADASGPGPSALARELAARHRGRVVHVYERALRGFAVALSAEDAAALAADARVARVEEDGVVRVAGVQDGAPWNLDALDALPEDGAYTYGATGQGVTVYVVDTGIRQWHYDFWLPPLWLATRVGAGHVTLADATDTADCNGHGTHVAGVVGGRTHGVAKEVALEPVRVLGCDGSGALSDVIAGVDWITASHVTPAVAVLSLAASPSPTFDDAVAAAVAAGVTFAVAAGDGVPDACGVSPARVAGALTVAATDQAGAAAPFSAQGPCVDLFAPGDLVTSAWHTSDLATAVASGTSQAAAHAAGAAALVLQARPAATPAQVADALFGASTRAPAGAAPGTPDRLLSVAALAASPPADATAPVVAITAPDDGATVSGTTVVTVDATDGTAVTRVELRVDGAFVASGTRKAPTQAEPNPPYTIAWDTTRARTGTRALDLRAWDASGNVGQAAARSVDVRNPGIAQRYAALGIPVCDLAAPSCDSRALVDGRGPLGPEANAPNALPDLASGVACPDGVLGAYHGDPSVDAVRVSTVDGADLAVGKVALAEVTVWSLFPDQEQLDLFVAGDAHAPAWQHVITLAPAGPGRQVLSVPFSVPEGSLPALRASYRIGGAVAACTAGGYDDRDDLAFVAGPGVADVAAPSVSITAPGDGATISGTLPFTVDATDADGVVIQVELYLDGDLLALDRESPYGVSWHAGALPDGDHVLTARAFDGAGHSAWSAPVAVHIRDTTPPKVSITAPEKDATVTGLTAVRAAATDDGVVARVELLLDGVSLGTDWSAPYQVVWNAFTALNGPHTLSARAIDQMGNVAESAPVVVKALDPNKPDVTVDSPVAGEAVKGVVGLAASVSDDGVVAGVEFLLRDAAGGETLLGAVAEPPYAMDWNSGTVPNGAYVLAVRARDMGGNERVATVAFEVRDGIAPAVALEVPWPGAILAGVAPLRATASDEGVVTRVELLVDGAVLATVAAPPYVATWDTTAAPNGTHAVAARAYDGTGNAAVTAPVTVVVSNPGAAFDAALGVPRCPAGRTYCHTGTLVDGRGVAGPEVNAPNTLAGACADGNQGAYHADESVDFVSVETIDGGPLTAGGAARVTARAWISSTVADRVDLFYAGDANAPGWTLLGTSSFTGAGMRTVTAEYVLPWGALQAVRAAVRHGGSAAPCTSGLFDDRDDLAFEVALPDDTTKPVVAITSPTADEHVEGIVPVLVTATDDVVVSMVEVSAGGVLVGSTSTPPYAVYWDTSGLAPGTHALTARAVDGKGNEATTAPVPVKVGDVDAPAITITAPAAGAVLAPGDRTLSADVTDDGGVARVELRVDGALVGALTSAPWQVTWNAGSVANGGHVLAVTAADLAGNVATATRTFSTLDATDPTVALTRPASGAFVSGAVLLEATAADDGVVDRVEFLRGTTVIAVDASAPYSAVWDASAAAPGDQALSAKAYDRAGHSAASAAVTVHVADTRAPVAALVAPLDGDTVAGTVAFQATAADDVAVARVEYWVDGAKTATATAAPWSATWDTTTATDGWKTAVARAFDAAGNAGESASIALLVANGDRAVYDRQLKVPRCGAAGAKCTSGALLVGRGNLGPEPKQPNTLASSCADGQNGSFHVDESVDAITVSTVDSGPLTAGKAVRVDVKVWAGHANDQDALDLWAAADARSPAWSRVATLAPAAPGAQVLSATFVLPAGSVQAVRATFRYGGTAAPCTTGSFDDHDDLAFQVAP